MFPTLLYAPDDSGTSGSRGNGGRTPTDAEADSSDASLTDLTEGGDESTATGGERQSSTDSTKRAEKRDSGDRNNRVFSLGFNEAQERALEQLREEGVEPVIDERTGKPSLKLTLASIAAGRKGADRSGTGKGGEEDEKYQEITGRLSVLETQLNAERSKRKEAEDRLADYVTEHEVAMAFTDLPVVDGAAKRVVKLFLDDYKVGRNVDGEVRVYLKPSGRILMNEEGHPATPKEAAQRWLDENSYFRAATMRAKGSGVEGRAGVRRVSEQDLLDGTVSPEDVVSGRVEVVPNQ